ncbi:MAG: lectin-like protein [Eisenbergiella sp.]
MTAQNSGDAREQERIEAGNSSEEGEFWSASSGDSSDQVPADEEDGTEEPEDTPSPSPTVTSEPTPVITATPEPTPESTIHRYEFVISDESWGEAFQSCISRGGYLARIETLEEWEEVTRQLEAQGLSENVFYIGGMRNSQSNTYYWVDTSMNLLTDEPVNDSSSP